MSEYRSINQQGMDYLMKQGVYSTNQSTQPYSYTPPAQQNQITSSQGMMPQPISNLQPNQISNINQNIQYGTGQSQVYIANLNWWTSDYEIEDLLNMNGVAFSSIRFLEEKYNGKSKGCVIINCKDPQVAQQCVSLFNGKDYQGRKLAVSIAQKEQLSQLEPKESVPQNQNLNIVLPQSAYQQQTAVSQQIPQSHVQQNKIQYRQMQPQSQQQQNIQQQNIMPPTPILGGTLPTQQGGMQYPLPPPPAAPPYGGQARPGYMMAPPVFQNKQ